MSDVAASIEQLGAEHLIRLELASLLAEPNDPLCGAAFELTDDVKDLRSLRDRVFESQARCLSWHPGTEVEVASMRLATANAQGIVDALDAWDQAWVRVLGTLISGLSLDPRIPVLGQLPVDVTSILGMVAVERVGRYRIADSSWKPLLAAAPTARGDAPCWGVEPSEWILLGDAGDPALPKVFRVAATAAAGRATLRWVHARRPWRAAADQRGVALEVKLRSAVDVQSAIQIVEQGVEETTHTPSDELGPLRDLWMLDQCGVPSRGAGVCIGRQVMWGTDCEALAAALSHG